MGEIALALEASHDSLRLLPHLDVAQTKVVEQSLHNHLIVRGAPGAGRTTCALSVFSSALARGENAMILVPDRLRAGVLSDRAHALAPNVLRPVRTPASLAYFILATWRTNRADPLGPLQLLSAAQEEAILADLIAHYDGVWPSSLPRNMRELPSFRTELRNLFMRAGEEKIGPDELRILGEKLAIPEWEASAELFERYVKTPSFSLSARESMRVSLSRIQHMAAECIERWDIDRADLHVEIDCPIPDVLIADDLQDCTPSTVALLKAAAGRGTRIMSLSDPDVAIASYRGGHAYLDQELERELIDPRPGARPVMTCELGGTYRHGTQLRALVRDVTMRITTSGSPARRQAGVASADNEENLQSNTALNKTQPADQKLGTENSDAIGANDDAPDEELYDDDERISIHVAASSSQLGALMARKLRAHYLYRGIPWREQVIIVRTSEQAADMRRAFRLGGVPVAQANHAFIFASQPVTRTLLALSSGPNNDEQQRNECAAILMSSPLVAADPLEVHRVERFLIGEKNTAHEKFSSVKPETAVKIDETTRREEKILDVPNGEPMNVLALLENPDILDTPSLVHAFKESSVLADLKRASSIWRAGLDTSEKRPRQALWQLWNSANIAQQWSEAALANSDDSDWYDDQLDAVIALFRVADIWEQRNPSSTAAAFAAYYLNEDVPTDTIAQIGQRPEGVEILTPAQAMGRQWKVVSIVGLQDGVWPSMRLRDRVLHAHLLADTAVLNGVMNADISPEAMQNWSVQRRELLDDETRLFAAAISRSREYVHFGAVRSEDAAPSLFIEWAQPYAHAKISEGVIELERVETPLNMSGMVGQLRHIAAQPHENRDRDVATKLLAILTTENIQGSDPSQWTGVGGMSTDVMLWEDGPVLLSPSTVASIKECPLQWFLSMIGGVPPSGDAQLFGTLVHAIAEQYPKGSIDSVLNVIEQSWDYLGYDDATWVGRKKREHARGVVRALGAYVESVPGRVETEVRVNVPLGDVTITGSIDRLEYVDGGVRIVDLKTGKAVSRQKAQEHPQLATYQVAMRAQGVNVVGARLVFLGAEKVEIRDQQALDDDGYAQWCDELQKIGRIMRGPTFDATPSQQAAQSSAFRRVCPAYDEGGRVLK